MEETRKRPREVTGEKSAAEVYGTAAAAGEGEEEEDEYYTVGELMKLLETEEAAKVKFIENPHSWTIRRFQSSSSYVTINGNEESCGPSFSDSESSVMASVDTAGVKLWSGDKGSEVERWLEEGGAWGTQEEGACVAEKEEGAKAEMEMEMDGGDWDDEMLMRFLGEEER